MSYEPDFEYKYNHQFRSRAVGQIYMGPLKKVGYNNKVLKITANELTFDSSLDANRFMDYQRKKEMNDHQQCNSRRLKLISMYDDR